MAKISFSVSILSKCQIFQAQSPQKIEPIFCFLCSCFLKILSGIAKSEYPDETSDLVVHYLHMPGCKKLW